MEQIILEFVKPELLVLVFVLYFIGTVLKDIEKFKDKFIPLLLMGVGILLATAYVVATSKLGNTQEIIIAIFTGIVQGILVAGLSTYVNQIYKQLKKKEGE